MRELHLDYSQKSAIRTLPYDPSSKIGVKFKSRWVSSLSPYTLQIFVCRYAVSGGKTCQLAHSFRGGQSFTDLHIRRAVYPSYGVDVENPAAVMIASSIWGQDSSRLGSYLNPHNPKTQAPYQPDSVYTLVDFTLRDLAVLNGVSHEFLLTQYEGYHVYDWYGSAYSNGAFAVFGPGQFSSVLPRLMMPAVGGHMHLAGEALSSGHAWIIGAVNSAWRTVFEILSTEGLEDEKKEFIDKWNIIDEVDMGWYNWPPEARA